MIKLINSVKSVEKTMNEVALVRQLRTYLSSGLTNEALAPVLQTAEIKNYKPGEIFFNEGDDEDDDDVAAAEEGVHRRAGGPLAQREAVEGVVAHVPLTYKQMTLPTKGLV